VEQAIERVQVPAWAWLVVLFAAFGVYLMSLDNGWALSSMASNVHEFFHDGRHFLSVPCH
jgi:hypothetical protein